jgi:hypothetical protein
LSPPNVLLEVDPTLVVPDVDSIAPVVSAAQEHLETEKDPYVGLSKSQARKLKAKLDKEAKLKEEEDAKRQREEEEAAEIRRQEEAEAELIRLEEEVAESRKLKEEEERIRIEEAEAELRKMAEEEDAVAAAEAEKFQKRGEEEADPWAAIFAAPPKKAKKKKSKPTEQMGLENQEAHIMNMEVQYAAAEDTGAEICPKKDDDPWDNWGSAALTTKKKKKSRKTDIIRLAEDEENEEIRREKENAAAAATNIDLSIVGSTGTTSGDDDCQKRVEHLSQNYGWQNCKPCELYMRKIAMKLHSEGLPIEDGFNTIN